jgi:hypothetical protein
MEIVDTERGQVLLFALAAVQYGGNWDFIEYARGNSRLKPGGQGGGIGSSEVFRDVDPPPLLGCWSKVRVPDRSRRDPIFVVSQFVSVSSSPLGCSVSRNVMSKNGGLARWQKFMICYLGTLNQPA